MKRERIWLLLSSLLLIVFLNGLILQKEHTLKHGQAIYLELAPRDPRSLMQGDYMDLRYHIAEHSELNTPDSPRQGLIVLCIDPRGIASFSRLYQGEMLVEGEQLLLYRRHNHRVRLGAESFFFQEGQAEVYERARYGKLVLSRKGKSILAGLTDEQLNDLRPDS